VATVPPAGARALAATPVAHPVTEHRELKLGMTPSEVRALLGEPTDELVFDRRTRWLFLDCTVIFQDGKVVEVRF